MMYEIVGKGKGEMLKWLMQSEWGRRIELKQPMIWTA
jgi:Txe/YoeB family toxin of Txe-Axe toxin-antitoxin module